MILETERLILRELATSDFTSLRTLLQDPEVMYAYEGSFTHHEVEKWFVRQQARYIAHGFGLWAVIRKEDGIFLGQCGITLQSYGDRQVPEIGYLLCRCHWHRGYATEAAAACKRLAFGPFGMQHIYSFIRDTNLPSQRVALRNGMRCTDTVVKHFRGIDMLHMVFRADNTSASGPSTLPPPNPTQDRKHGAAELLRDRHRSPAREEKRFSSDD